MYIMFDTVCEVQYSSPILLRMPGVTSSLFFIEIKRIAQNPMSPKISDFGTFADNVFRFLTVKVLL